MQRSGWSNSDLIKFLTENGLTPQVASRRANEIRRNSLYNLAIGYKELSEMDLYSEEERYVYLNVAKELLRAAGRD